MSRSTSIQAWLRSPIIVPFSPSADLRERDPYLVHDYFLKKHYLCQILVIYTEGSIDLSQHVAVPR